LAEPSGATHRLTIHSNPEKVPADMPDDGSSVFAADLVIDEALGTNWEGGAQSFINGLAADLSDLRVFTADDSTEVAWGLKQFSQTSGSRKLVLGLGLPALSASAPTTYRLYRGCTGGPFENREGVVPISDGCIGYWPLEESAPGTGTPQVYKDWCALHDHGNDYIDKVDQTGQVGCGVERNRDDGDYIYGSRWPLDYGAMSAALSAFTWARVDQRVDDHNGWQWLFGNWREGGHGGWDMWVSGRDDPYGVGVHLATTAGDFTTDAYYADLGDGLWHQFGFVYDGTEVLIYVDGVPLGRSLSPTGDVTPSTSYHMSPAGHGRWKNVAGLYGHQDETHQWKVAWSADRISTMFNCQSDNDGFWTVGNLEELHATIPPLHLTGDGTQNRIICTGQTRTGITASGDGERRRIGV